MSKILNGIIVAAVMMGTQSGFAETQEESVALLKKQIFALAKSFEGQGDPDQSKQKKIEVLIKELTRLRPMPPIKERIPVLAGTWKQVWGPYDYRNDNGGVDPELEVKEIYQVVSERGYYYNVAPLYRFGNRNRERIGLLRGEYKLDEDDANGLRVKFTNYPGVKPRPSGLDIWELAALAESGELQNEITIVPSWIVRLFFGGGKLEEIYTDSDMRLLYGMRAKAGSRKSLYVMSRVK